jgi:hypothetical protein
MTDFCGGIYDAINISNHRAPGDKVTDELKSTLDLDVVACLEKYCGMTAESRNGESEWTSIAGQRLANTRFVRHVSNTKDCLLWN